MAEMIRLERRHSRDLFWEIARLHARSIHHGVLPRLGLSFLEEVYAAIVKSRYGIVFVIIERGMLLGFVAGTPQLNRLYLDVLIKDAWRLFIAARPHLGQIALWKKMWSVLSFPSRQTRPQMKNGGGPELLAIAVIEEHRGAGLGGQLLQAFENELRGSNADGAYSVATNAAEIGSNQFYQKSGFHPIGKMTHHQLLLQLYEKEL